MTENCPKTCSRCATNTSRHFFTCLCFYNLVTFKNVDMRSDFAIGRELQGKGSE